MSYFISVKDITENVSYLNQKECKYFSVFKYFKHAEPCYFIIIPSKDTNTVYTSRTLTKEMETDTLESMRHILLSKNCKKFYTFDKEGTLILRNDKNKKNSLIVTCNRIAYKFKVENLTSDKVLLNITTVDKNVYFQLSDKDTFMIKISDNIMEIYTSNNLKLMSFNDQVGQFEYRNNVILILYEKIIASLEELLISELDDIFEFIQGDNNYSPDNIKTIIDNIYILVNKTSNSSINKHKTSINKTNNDDIDKLYSEIIEKKLSISLIDDIYDILSKF